MTLPPVYPILDTASLARLDMPLMEAAEALLEGGARILQLRHKAFWSRQVFADAERVAKLCKEAGVPFVLNDRADYAALLQCGLHVGQEDLSPEQARMIVGTSAVIGFSTHNAQQMEEARNEPVDYVAFGPVFTTLSKERPDPIAGIENLRSVRSLTAKPLVAIGGITRDNAFDCRNAGADSVAVIADLLPTPCSGKAMRERMAEWRQLK